MRFFLLFLIIVLIFGPASADRNLNNQNLTNYRTTSKTQYLKYPAYEQAIYVEGLYDSLRFFASRGAAGDELAKCLFDAETFVSQITISDLFKKTLEKADESEPLASVLLRTFQKFCNGLKK